jgi:hypothetical protein
MTKEGQADSTLEQTQPLRSIQTPSLQLQLGERGAAEEENTRKKGTGVLKLTEEQMSLMKRIGATLDMPEEVIEERVAFWLTTKGFDENYGITKEGRVCESILDLIP